MCTRGAALSGAFMEDLVGGELSSESVGISGRAWGGVEKHCFPAVFPVLSHGWFTAVDFFKRLLESSLAPLLLALAAKAQDA